MPVAKLNGGWQLGGGGLQWLYGLQEQDGAASAGDSSGGPNRPRLTSTQVGTGGEMVFGFAGVMPEGTAVRFQAESPGNGLTLGVGSALTSYLAGGWTLVGQFSWTGATSVQLLRLGGSSGGATVTIAATLTKVTATVADPGGTTVVSTMTATRGNRPHFFALVSHPGDATLTLHVDGDSASKPWRRLQRAHGLTLGSTANTAAHQLAWIGFLTRALPAAEVADLIMLGTGGSERSDRRVARILRWLGVAGNLTTEEGLSDVGRQNFGGSQALDLIASVHDVEQGAFFVAGDGRFINHSRAHRRGQSPVLLIDAADIEPDGFAIQVDETRVVNDLSLTSTSGETVRVVNEASVLDHERRTDPKDAVPATTTDELRSAAEWLGWMYGTPEPRVPSITLNLLTHDSAFAQQVLGLEIGDLIRVTGLPDQAPASTLDLFVEGFPSEVMSATSWLVTIATSPGRNLSTQLNTPSAVLGSTFTLTY